MRATLNVNQWKKVVIMEATMGREVEGNPISPVIQTETLVGNIMPHTVPEVKRGLRLGVMMDLAKVAVSTSEIFHGVSLGVN
jgi:hypothetical protein